MVDGAPGPAPVSIGPLSSWCQGDWQVGPMHQVGADGVPPVNVRMEGTVRIVLVEEVILPFPLE